MQDGILTFSALRRELPLIVGVLPLKPALEGGHPLAERVSQLREPSMPEKQNHDGEDQEMTKAEAEHK